MEERLHNFQAFLHDEGITFDDTSIRFAQSKLHGFGVLARKSIPVGAVVATIPKSAILSVQTSSLWASHTPHSLSTNIHTPTTTQHIDQHWRNNRCPPIFQLPAAALFETLLSHRSRWARYLAIMPQSLAEIGVPLAETDADVAVYCQGTGVDLLSKRLRRDLRHAFRHFVRPLFLERALQFGVPESVVRELDEEQFFLAFAWVTSRAFQVDDFHGSSLVPVADMFNHRSGGEHVHIEGTGGDVESEGSESTGELADSEHAGDYFGMPTTSQRLGSRDGRNGTGLDDVVGGEGLVESKDKTDDDLRIVCVRDVRAGEEVFNTFGDKSSAVLYLNYGFTEESNSHETALVHKSDVQTVLEQFSATVRDPNSKMTTSRRRCIEGASIIVDDDVVDVLDDFFQITADGTFCHGIMLLIYLYATPWEKIEPFFQDEVDFLGHVLDLTVADIMNAAGDYVVQIAGDIVERQIRKIPDVIGENASSQSASEPSVAMKRLEKHARRIRNRQRSVLEDACNALRQTALDRKCSRGSGMNANDEKFTGSSEPKRKRPRTEGPSESDAVL